MQQTYFLSFWAIFCPTPLFTLKMKIWNKCTKCLEILCFYKCVPKMKIMMYVTWYKGWYFLPFFCPLILLTPQKSKFCKNEKKRLEILSFCLCVPKTTIIWGTTPEMQSETHDFLSFWTIFLSCYPPNKLKNQNFEKMKKISGDFIILHMCTKNHDHMMYASWDMECNRHNFFPGDIIILH